MNQFRKLTESGYGDTQALSGAGTIDRNASLVKCTSTGSAQALVLGAGLYHGQRIRIVHVVDGGSVVLTHGANVTLARSLASITLADVRDWVELQWDEDLATPAWDVIAESGCAFA